MSSSGLMIGKHYARVPEAHPPADQHTRSSNPATQNIFYYTRLTCDSSPTESGGHSSCCHPRVPLATSAAPLNSNRDPLGATRVRGWQSCMMEQAQQAESVDHDRMQKILAGGEHM
jgi:hypothetical protein